MSKGVMYHSKCEDVVMPHKQSHMNMIYSPSVHRRIPQDNQRVFNRC